MKLVRLTKGYFAMVDDEDFKRVSAFKWRASEERGRVYGARTLRRVGKRGNQKLHSFILETAEEIHHEDGNGLNDQKYNLTICTRSRNMRGAIRKRKTATSPYRGVCWDSRCRRWMAQITVGPQQIFLGRFDCPEEAARVRDSASLRYFGEFAHLNFPA